MRRFILGHESLLIHSDIILPAKGKPAFSISLLKCDGILLFFFRQKFLADKNLFFNFGTTLSNLITHCQFTTCD